MHSQGPGGAEESWRAGEHEKPAILVGDGALDPSETSGDRRIGAEEPSGIFCQYCLVCLLSVCMHKSHSTHAEVRGQPVGLLLPCGSQGLNSGHRAWEKLPV